MGERFRVRRWCRFQKALLKNDDPLLAISQKVSQQTIASQRLHGSLMRQAMDALSDVNWKRSHRQKMFFNMKKGTSSRGQVGFQHISSRLTLVPTTFLSDQRLNKHFRTLATCEGPK